MAMRGPLLFGLNRAWRIALRAGFKFHEIDGNSRAASFAFYAFFALFPLIILFVTVGSFFLNHDEVVRQVMKNVEEYIPLGKDDQASVESAVHGALRARRGASILAVLGLLWSASQLFHAMVRGVNRAWGTTEHPWWQVPIKSLAMLGVVATALFVGVLVPVVVKSLSGTAIFGGEVFTGMFRMIALLAPSLVLFCGLSLFYKVAPRRRTLFSEVVLAALIVTVLLQVSRSLFERYVNHFANFNALYGTLAVIVVLLMWIYLSGIIIIYGGCLCAARSEKPAVPDRAHQARR
jgi:YihY family inner membrane protein